MKMSPDTSYCIRGWCESNGMVIGDLMEYAKIKNVNFDILIDNNGIKKGLSILQKHFNYWYWNLSSRLEKTKIFYKFVNSIESEIRDLFIELPAWYRDNKIKLDKRKNILTLINDLTKVAKDINKRADFRADGFINTSISNFEGMMKRILKKLRTYSKHCYYKLDKIMRLEYAEHMRGGLVSMNSFTTNTINTSVGWTNSTVSTITGSSTYSTYSDSSNSIRLITDGTTQNLSYTVTEGTGVSNIAVNGSYVGQSSYEFSQIPFSPPKIDYKKEKKERKQTRNIIKKSINGLKKFVPYNNIKSFINGAGFEVIGHKYKWVISKKEHYTVEKYSKILNSIHIPYELKLYSKENEFLADLCVTFSGCPILDQILSTVLHIKSGDEDGLLENCNFYNPSEEGLRLKKSIRGGEDSSSNTGTGFNLSDTGIISTTASVINNNTVTSTVSLIDHSMTRILKKNYDKEKIHKKNVAHVKKGLNEIFKKLFGPELFEFILNKPVSWDELNDYYMMEDYNYDVLDSFVCGGRGDKNRFKDTNILGKVV